MKARAALFLAVLPLLGLASPAGAQSATERDSDARFQEGVKLVKEKKYDDARVKFAQAYAIFPSSKVLLNLGLAEKDSGHALDALKHLKEYAESKDANPEKVEALKRDVFPSLMGQTGHVRIVAPDGATARVDGTAVPGAAPFAEAVDVAPGDHRVEGQLATHSLSAATVTVAAGQEGTATLTDPTPAATATPIPVAPAPPPASPGVSEGNQAPPVVAPPATERSSMRWIVGGAVAGIGLIAAGVGIGFLVDAGHQQDTVDSIRAQQSNPDAACNGSTSTLCQQRADAADAHHRDATAGPLLLIGGVAGVAVGVAAVLFWPSTPSETRTGLRPLLAPGVAGASWGGRF